MAQMTEETIRLQGKSTFPASKKVYQQGSRPDLLVPFREVALTPTGGRFGIQQNPPMRLYDTSGPYTDDNATLDVRQGLPALRKNWILERGDVEETDRILIPISGRNVAEAFPGLERRPAEGQAQQGRHPDALRQARHHHPGDGVHRHPRGNGSLNSCAARWPAAGPSSPATSTTLNRSR